MSVWEAGTGPRSYLLTAATLCCLPHAILVFTGATTALIDAAFYPTTGQPILVLALLGAHAVSVALLVFSIAIYSHWVRLHWVRTSTGYIHASTIGKGKRVEPDRAVEARNRKASMKAVDRQPQVASQSPHSSLSPSVLTHRLQYQRAELDRRHEEPRSQPDYRQSLGSPLSGMYSSPAALASPGAMVKSPAPSNSIGSKAVFSGSGSNFMGAGFSNELTLYNVSSPFAISSPAFLVQDGSGLAKRRLSEPGMGSGANGGSGSKYQRAMYVPSSSDTHEDPSMIARRALLLRAHLFLPQHKLLLHEHEATEPELQRLLRTIDHDQQMDRWRDNLRMWMSAVVLQPLAQLFEANEKLVQQAAAAGIAAPAAAAGAAGGGLFGAIGASPYANLGGTFAPTAPPLFGPKPAAALPGAPAPGQAMTVPQWLQHAHADEKSKALKHQHGKLRRFTAAWQELRGFSAESASYVQRRIRELADGHCVACYKWDGGGAQWNSSLPMDSEVLVHVFATFFDMILSSPGA
ncbi:transmembrane protein 209, partial [Chrysochromulina tobinii]